MLDQTEEKLVQVGEGVCSDCGEATTVIKVGAYGLQRNACRKCVKNPIKATRVLLVERPGDQLVVDMLAAFQDFQAGGSPEVATKDRDVKLSAAMEASGTCSRCKQKASPVIKVAGTNVSPSEFYSCLPCGPILIATLLQSTEMICRTLTGHPELPKFKAEVAEIAAWIEELVRSKGKGN